MIVGDDDIDTTMIEDETQGTSNIKIPSPAESQMTTLCIDEDENERTGEEDKNSSITNIIILQETDTNILAIYKRKESIKNMDRNKKNNNNDKKRKREDTETSHEITRNNFSTDSTSQSPTESQVTTDNVEENENGSNNNQTGKRTRKKRDIVQKTKNHSFAPVTDQQKGDPGDLYFMKKR